MNKYNGINYWNGIWGNYTTIVNNTVWKPWTPMVVRIREGTLKPQWILDSELIASEEIVAEIKCVNVNNIKETIWLTAAEFKDGMNIKLNIENKIDELQSTLKMLKSLVKL